MLTEEDLIQLVRQNKSVIERLLNLGIIPTTESDCHGYNIGNSNYSKYLIQPWAIWQEYRLNPWDADIVKRVLRTKEGESRKLDYEKIIHICKKRIEQIERGVEI